MLLFNYVYVVVFSLFPRLSFLFPRLSVCPLVFDLLIVVLVFIFFALLTEFVLLLPIFRFVGLLYIIWVDVCLCVCVCM